MNVVNLHLVRAFRKLRAAFASTRKKHRDTMRPIPEPVVELYHRAVWALDMLGPPAEADRYALVEMWRNATHVAANASGPEGGAIAEDIIRTLQDQSARVVNTCEKDQNRPIWEKQRDFLIGSLRRVRRAMMLNEVEHLHYYKKQNQIFSVDLHHPDFQVGYDLWQGICIELKAAVTFVIYNDRPLSPRVDYLVTQMRKIIQALESADTSMCEMYEKSPLHLSKEEEGRRLWEAVREQAAKVIAISEGGMN